MRPTQAQANTRVAGGRPRWRRRITGAQTMSSFIGKAAEAAAAIIKAFENPNSLPGPLATIFIRRQDNIPCRKWSWRNQLLVALAGHTDARGFRQWQEVGRWVTKGEKSFQILAPVLKTVRDDGTGEERQVVVGFRGVPVFGLGQTDGKPLPAGDPDAERWIESLPLVEVACRGGCRSRRSMRRRAALSGYIDGEGTRASPSA